MTGRKPNPSGDSTYSKRCWFTFPSRNQVEQPIIWQMSRKFPDVMFDIRQASVQNEIGIMAVLLSGTGLPTIGVIEVLERDLGKPVVSSNQASLWRALRLAGVRESISGFGRLLSAM